MSEEGDKKTAVGSVEEVLPDSLFRVRLLKEADASSEAVAIGEETNVAQKASPGAVVEGELVLAYLAGKMRLHRIRVLVGDQVEWYSTPMGAVRVL